MAELLPNGTWICVDVPLGTTEEELSEFLKAHYLEIEPANISVREYEGRRACAIVSVQNEVILDLFNWATNGDALNSYPITGRLRQPRRN